MAEKLKVGQRVSFRRSHDKATQLIGRIVAIDPKNPTSVAVKTEADGRLVEKAGIEHVHAADVTVLDDQTTPAKAKENHAQEEKSEEETEGAAD